MPKDVGQADSLPMRTKPSARPWNRSTCERWGRRFRLPAECVTASNGAEAMASRKIEEKLDRLSSLREADRTEAIAALPTALADRANVVVAKSAKIAADLELQDLSPDLVRAFDRLFEKPVETDPQCWGKNAIAITLRDFGYQSSAPFLRGLRHIQMEPVWGGREDTAQVLRAACRAALPQCADLTRAEVLRHLVSARTDVSDKVRVAAVRAM